MVETPIPNIEGMLELVDKTRSGAILLPDFQRSFVWENQDIKDLLVSLLSGYFIGNLLFLRRRDTFDFRVRYFEGVPQTNPTLPSDPESNRSVEKVVLDGQQRLTALFYAIHCPPEISPKRLSSPIRYFLNIEDRLNGKEWDDCIWAVSENDATRNLEVDLGSGRSKNSFRELIKATGDFRGLLSNVEFQKYCHTHGLIPFAALSGESKFNSWLREYTRFYSETVEGQKKAYEREDRIRKLTKDWLSFSVPTLTLENRPLWEVAEIFERINRTGVELSTFALATAVFYKHGLNIRDLWNDYYENQENDLGAYCDESDERYPKYILQVVALLQGKEPKKKVLINPAAYEMSIEKWKEACSLLDKALMRTKNTTSGYGVIKPDLIPYKTAMAVLPALMASAKTNEHFQKLDSWYWSSVFTGRYAGASETAMKQDYDQVIGWLSDSTNVPEVVMKAERDVKDINLSDVEPKGALYKSILNMLALEGPLDLATGQSIELHTLNDHHIFPKKCGIELLKENSITNRTLISDHTNKHIIGAKKPSVYIREMSQKFGSETRVRAILSSHLIDENAFNAMANDDYAKFVEARAQLMRLRMTSMIQVGQS